MITFKDFWGDVRNIFLGSTEKDLENLRRNFIEKDPRLNNCLVRSSVNEVLHFLNVKYFIHLPE